MQKNQTYVRNEPEMDERSAAADELRRAICCFEGIRPEYFAERWTLKSYVAELSTARTVKLMAFLLNP